MSLGPLIYLRPRGLYQAHLEFLKEENVASHHQIHCRSELPMGYMQGVCLWTEGWELVLQARRLPQSGGGSDLRPKLSQSPFLRTSSEL